MNLTVSELQAAFLMDQPPEKPVWPLLVYFVIFILLTALAMMAVPRG